MPPWNDWFHCTGCTYGSWLPGDPRGFRTRHHREHVEGDYTNPPPPGKYDRLHAHAKDLMSREPVRLTPPARRAACHLIVEALAFHNLDAAALAVDDHHFHLLARVPDHDPRLWIGHIKRYAARALSIAGLVAPGGVWARRSRAEPVRDRAHHIEIVRYIRNHASRGASVWTPPTSKAPSDQSLITTRPAAPGRQHHKPADSGS